MSRAYLTDIAQPNYDAYVAAENALTTAHALGDPAALDRAERDAWRAAWNATVSLHQLADYAYHELRDTDHAAVAGFENEIAFRQQVVDPLSAEMLLLHHAGDALKHYKLRNPARREVTGADAMVVLVPSWATLPWGHFKWEGGPQVLVVHKRSPRALRHVLTSAVTIWQAQLVIYGL